MTNLNTDCVSKPWSFCYTASHWWSSTWPWLSISWQFPLAVTEQPWNYCPSCWRYSLSWCKRWAQNMFNSLWPSDAIWRQKSGSTLAQVMACCLTAPSHYLNQCWFIISKVLWHSSEDIIIGRFEDTNQWSKIENYNYKITLRSPRGQWVNLNSYDHQFSELVQKKLNSSANALELHLFCIKPSNYWW